MSIFVNFGRTGVPHDPPKIARVDLPTSLPSAAAILEAAAGAVEKLWRICADRREKLSRAAIGGPEDPLLAVAFAAVLEGFESEALPILFPRRKEEDPGLWVFDLDDPVETGELKFSGIELAEALRGTQADLSSLPIPPATYGTAFLCFGDPAIPTVGADAVRMDLPIRIPTTGEELAPGDHPHGWDLLTGAAAFDHRDSVLKSFQAAKVILGLPDHAGLSVTLSYTWEHFYKELPLILGASVSEGEKVFDLRTPFSILRAREAGKRLRLRIARAELG